MMRCARCKKKLRSNAAKWRREEWKRYTPYCSYHCQEWAKLENATTYVARLRDEQRSEPDPRRNRNRGERVCAECNYMARIGHVCTKCGAPDPAWNDQRSEPPAFGMEAEAIASAQLAMEDAQRSEPDARRNEKHEERVCTECNYMARIGHVCTKCGAPDPAWNDQHSEPCKHVWSNPPGGRLICDECGLTVKEDDMPEDEQRSERRTDAES